MKIPNQKQSVVITELPLSYVKSKSFLGCFALSGNTTYTVNVVHNGGTYVLECHLSHVGNNDSSANSVRFVKYCTQNTRCFGIFRLIQYFWTTVVRLISATVSYFSHTLANVKIMKLHCPADISFLINAIVQHFK